MNTQSTTRQAAPDVRITNTWRHGDANTVHLTFNTSGTSNSYEANIIADLITRTVTLTDYSKKTIDGSVSFLTPVALAPDVRSQVESSLADLIVWDNYPVVPDYSISNYRDSYVARVSTDDAEYLVGFDGIDMDDTCTRITCTDAGEVEEEIKTPDWMHYSVAAVLYSDAA